MKRAGLIAALLLVLTACSSSGPSRSYKLGQYDGPRLAATAQPSPDGIAAACGGQLSKYQTQAANTARYKKQKANQSASSQRLLTRIGQVSTPDFTMQAADVNRSDYLGGCKAALKARLR